MGCEGLRDIDMKKPRFILDCDRIIPDRLNLLQRCACEDLHFFNLRGSRKQFIGSRPQCLRNLASQVGIAAPSFAKVSKMPNFPGASLIAYHFKVPFSFSASG